MLILLMEMMEKLYYTNIVDVEVVGGEGDDGEVILY